MKLPPPNPERPNIEDRRGESNWRNALIAMAADLERQAAILRRLVGVGGDWLSVAARHDRRDDEQQGTPGG